MTQQALATLVHVGVLALGVAFSPLPVVAVIVVLLTRRARVGSLVFAVCWVVGVACAIAIGIVFAGKISPPRFGTDLPSESLVTLLFGIGLVITGWLSRRGRLRSDDPDAAPRWVAAVDNLSPAGGALVAFSNALTSPKNLALAIACGAYIQSATRTRLLELSSALVYIVVASLFVVTPVVVYFFAGQSAQPMLLRWKAYVTSQAGAIMEITLFVLGIVLALKGLYNLLS